MVDFDSLLMSFSRSSNIAVQLVERGLASVIRHRKDDENRSQAYDQLMIAESK
jgi:staphylococcal nuclease domain-containing protein 1